MQDKLSTIFDNLGVFFAFSDEQMKEGLKKTKTKIKDLTSIGAGGFIPKKNATEYLKVTDKLMDWLASEVKKLDPIKVIKYELANYECYYTGDISTAYDQLKDFGYTREQVQEVYNQKIHRA